MVPACFAPEQPGADPKVRRGEQLDAPPTVQVELGRANSGWLLLQGVLPIHSLQLSKWLKWQSQTAPPGDFRISQVPFKPRPSQENPTLEQPGLAGQMWPFGWASLEQPEVPPRPA